LHDRAPGAVVASTKGTCVNKSQLIDTLAARFEGNRKAAAHALDSVLDTITREVARGEKVAITGFGSFEKRVRGARWVRNPATGARMQSSEKAVPAFRPGAGLRDVVSGAKKLPALTLAAVEAAAPAVAQPAIARTAAAARRATGGGSSDAVEDAGSAAKKSAAKKSAAKKSATKSAAKKSAAKKSPTKSTAKKSAAKKSAARSTAKKSAGKKSGGS
jgi:DNA-binding protein HU-beta